MYKLEELSIADLEVIKNIASNKVFHSSIITDQKNIDYWDDVYHYCKTEINTRITEIFPLP